MRAKSRKLKKLPVVHLPAPEPTIRELAEKAVSLFNPGGDKTRYIAFLNHYSKEKQTLIIREMQEVWRSR